MSSSLLREVLIGCWGLIGWSCWLGGLDSRFSIRSWDRIIMCVVCSVENFGAHHTQYDQNRSIPYLLSSCVQSHTGKKKSLIICKILVCTPLNCVLKSHDVCTKYTKSQLLLPNISSVVLLLLSFVFQTPKLFIECWCVLPATEWIAETVTQS